MCTDPHDGFEFGHIDQLSNQEYHNLVITLHLMSCSDSDDSSEGRSNDTKDDWQGL